MYWVQNLGAETQHKLSHDGHDCTSSQLAVLGMQTICKHYSNTLQGQSTFMQNRAPTVTVCAAPTVRSGDNSSTHGKVIKLHETLRASHSLHFNNLSTRHPSTTRLQPPVPGPHVMSHNRLPLSQGSTTASCWHKTPITNAPGTSCSRSPCSHSVLPLSQGSTTALCWHKTPINNHLEPPVPR
jgi:hypothetical protein